MSQNKCVLLVVDMQNDFISGSLAMKDCPAKQDGNHTIHVVNKLTSLPNWDLIVYTKDWHPADHISFVTNAYKFERHEESTIDPTSAEVYDKVVFNVDGNQRREQVLWPPHCIQSSWGSELHPDLLVANGSHIVTKGMDKHVDSYSAFFDNQHLQETELRELLQRNNITHVFVCGVATDVCVNFTVQDSLDLGYQTYLVEDACAGVSWQNIEVQVKKLVEKKANIIQSDQVSAELEKLHNDKTTVTVPCNHD
uniref:nicotinamidase n=1 Tax=Phallusia mammillata TaxID=59560 RepID=A0A6F9DG08_9ASCI|nr:isochorismatase domain-containing protein 2-like [Phallusia mammillata]